MTVLTGADNHKRSLLLIGTSTGGPQALTRLFETLPVLPRTSCCIVQHMPAGFTTNLAKRLDQVSSWHVKEAEHAEVLESGVAYVAPGGFQMKVAPHQGWLRLVVEQSGAWNGHQPSVDVLFESATQHWTGPVVAVLMTGMGKDGAFGLKAIRDNGGYTIAEHESTCVVYGMPKAAVNLGAVVRVSPLGGIHQEVMDGWTALQTRR